MRPRRPRRLHDSRPCSCIHRAMALKSLGCSPSRKRRTRSWVLAACSSESVVACSAAISASRHLKRASRFVALTSQSFAEADSTCVVPLVLRRDDSPCRCAWIRTRLHGLLAAPSHSLDDGVRALFKRAGGVLRFLGSPFSALQSSSPELSMSKEIITLLRALEAARRGHLSSNASLALGLIESNGVPSSERARFMLVTERACFCAFSVECLAARAIFAVHSTWERHMYRVALPCP